jgi:hypothetical protein
MEGETKAPEISLKKYRVNYCAPATESADESHSIIGYFASVRDCSDIFKVPEAIIDFQIARHFGEDSDDDLLHLIASNGKAINFPDLVFGIKAHFKNEETQNFLYSGRSYFFEGISVDECEGMKVFRINWGS